MRQDEVDALLRQVIGGDPEAISRIVAAADGTDGDPLVLAMAALLEDDPRRLDRAGAVAVTTRDRQVVAIARAHLERNDALVDVFARDHLADFPDSLIVAWIASDGVARERRRGLP